MELLLWRWSTTAQIASALMIAVFFVVLSRSVRRIELSPWVNAWLANLLALAVTTIFWLAQPQSPVVFIFLRAGYLFGKTLFLVLLAEGAWSFARKPVSERAARRLIASIALYAVVGAFVLSSIDRIGVAQSALTALLLGGSAVILLKRDASGFGWLAAGFSLRAMLGAIETVAYATGLFPKVFTAAHSSFDTGAEWVIALGCVLTLYRTIQRELTQSNADLVAATAVLQDLVDLDPLTGLANRRGLPALLRECYSTGATVLFFDLNDFKKINDSYGHQAGDDCLKRFAGVLQTSFRPADHVIRYAGDEFVVLAPAVEPAQILDRVEAMRERLKFERTDGPPIRFSVGHAYLPVHGEAETALRNADEAMYRDKAGKTSRLRSI